MLRAGERESRVGAAHVFAAAMAPQTCQEIDKLIKREFARAQLLAAASCSALFTRRAMFRHVKRLRSPRSDGGDSTGSEVESDVDAAGSEGSDDVSDAGTVASIPDHLPSADSAAAEPIYDEPDGRRRCVLCPDKTLLNADVEKLHLSSKVRLRGLDRAEPAQSHARRAKRYTVKLAEFRAALEENDDEPVDPREIVRISDADKTQEPAPKSKKKRRRRKPAKAADAGASAKCVGLTSTHAD